jgi:hypothetical protein
MDKRRAVIDLEEGDNSTASLRVDVEHAAGDTLVPLIMRIVRAPGVDKIVLIWYSASRWPYTW